MRTVNEGAFPRSLISLESIAGKRQIALEVGAAIANFDLTLQCTRADGRTVILADGCREKYMKNV